MSIKNPKFRMGLRLVILIMFGMVIHNSIQDVNAYRGRLRRTAALAELNNMSAEAVPTIQIAKR